MKTEPLLRKARAAREREHRLKPSLRLKTISEVREFIHNKGLVSVLGGNELPGLVSAILGRPWKPSRKGFTGWLEWWSVKISGRPVPHWMGELEREGDILASRIFRQSKTLVSSRLWPILTPIVKRYEKLAEDHEILSESEWRILDTLQKDGPTRTDHLRSNLRLQAKEQSTRFHRALIRLESYGLIVGYEDPHPEKHLHANIWQVWDRRVGEALKEAKAPSYEEALAQLVEKAIDSSVFVPEREVDKWFMWDGVLAEVKEKLVMEDRVIRAGSFLVAARVVR